jgi:hypothetical protein
MSVERGGKQMPKKKPQFTEEQVQGLSVKKREQLQNKRQGSNK